MAVKRALKYGLRYYHYLDMVHHKSIRKVINSPQHGPPAAGTNVNVTICAYCRSHIRVRRYMKLPDVEVNINTTYHPDECDVREKGLLSCGYIMIPTKFSKLGHKLLRVIKDQERAVCSLCEHNTCVDEGCLKGECSSCNCPACKDPACTWNCETEE